MKKLLVFMLLVMSFPAFAADRDENRVEISDAWARATPRTAKNAAAYMHLENKTGSPDALVGVESNVSEMAEIHRTSENEYGVMLMEHQDEVALPAGEKIAFKPGGLHIMLMGLHKPLQEGLEFPLTLHFANAPSRYVRVKIEPINYQGKN